MQVLLVVAHPDRTSLTHALAHEFVAGAAVHGHRFDWLDLYAEGFDPVASLEEYRAWPRREVSPEIVRQQARVQAAAGLVLCYPIWWATPPAILQGWLQRVFTQGFAFEYGAGPHGRLRQQAQLIVNIGSRDESQRERYTDPILSVLNYCGMRDVSVLANWGVYSSSASGHIEACLARSREAGAAFG